MRYAPFEGASVGTITGRIGDSLTMLPGSSEPEIMKRVVLEGKAVGLPVDKVSDGSPFLGTDKLSQRAREVLNRRAGHRGSVALKAAKEASVPVEAAPLDPSVSRAEIEHQPFKLVEYINPKTGEHSQNIVYDEPGSAYLLNGPDTKVTVIRTTVATYVKGKYIILRQEQKPDGTVEHTYHSMKRGEGYSGRVGNVALLPGMAREVPETVVNMEVAAEGQLAEQISETRQGSNPMQAAAGNLGRATKAAMKRILGNGLGGLDNLGK